MITELKYQALQAQMNPHFIFNAINSISYLVNNNQSLKADYYLKQFAQLLRGVLEHAPNSYVSLLKEIQLVQNYLEIEQLQFGDQFEFKIDLDESLMLDNYKIPPMLLQPQIDHRLANNQIMHIKIFSAQLNQ